jgi:hypothetical protein
MRYQRYREFFTVITDNAMLLKFHLDWFFCYHMLMWPFLYLVQSTVAIFFILPFFNCCSHPQFPYIFTVSVNYFCALLTLKKDLILRLLPMFLILVHLNILIV